MTKIFPQLLFLLMLVSTSHSCSIKYQNARTNSEQEQSNHRRINTASTNELRFFTGKLGTDDIQMKLRRNGETLSGIYTYLPVGSINELEGKIDGQGEFTLYEFYNRISKQEVFRTFKGRWKDSETDSKIEGSCLEQDREQEKGFDLVEQHFNIDANHSFFSKEINKTSTKGKYKQRVVYPQISGEDNAGYEKTNREISELVSNQVRENEWGEDDSEDDGLSPAMSDAYNTFSMDYKITFANSDLVSIIFIVEVYGRGTAHGNRESLSFNFDVKAGRALELNELFKFDANYLQVISKYCTDDLRKQFKDVVRHEFAGEHGTSAKEENFQSWNITEKGLSFSFDPYQVGSYADGAWEVTVPYDVLQGTINPRSSILHLASGSH